eukprot:ANDGO_07463.mRNA.1 hypothetical protein
MRDCGNVLSDDADYAVQHITYAPRECFYDNSEMYQTTLGTDCLHPAIALEFARFLWSVADRILPIADMLCLLVNATISPAGTAPVLHRRNCKVHIGRRSAVICGTTIPEFHFLSVAFHTTPSVYYTVEWEAYGAAVSCQIIA